MRILKLRCKLCGYWNRVPVSKVLVEQDSPEPKVKVFIPMYLPLQTKCEKCGEVIAQPKELLKIVKNGSVNSLFGFFPCKLSFGGLCYLGGVILLLPVNSRMMNVENSL